MNERMQMNAFKRTLLLMICFPLVLQASTVIWGTGTIERPDPDHPIQWSFWASDDQHISMANFFFESVAYVSGVRITSSEFAIAACGSAFSLMNEGEVVNAASMASGNLFSDPYGMVNGNDVYGITIPISTEHEIYLGFVTDVYMDDGSGDVQSGYGWMKIGVNGAGEIVPKAAAIDLDGGAMIVGGGAFIPEPTSGLLLLVGGAMLALRRRR